VKEKLKALAKQFFKINSEVKKIFITEDRHCWYEEGHAIKHCGGVKKYEMFTPIDFEQSKPKVKQKPKLQKEA